MDLGDRIHTGIQRQECCMLCNGAIMMGDTLRPFTCGHVAHNECVRSEIDRLNQERRARVRRRRRGQTLTDTNINCAVCFHRTGLLNSHNLMPVPQNQPPQEELPPPAPQEDPGYIGRPLCGLCFRGSGTLLRMIHPCGLIVCRTCFNIAPWKNCPVCNIRLADGSQPFNVDPRQLEDVVNQGQINQM